MQLLPARARFMQRLPDSVVILRYLPHSEEAEVKMSNRFSWPKNHSTLFYMMIAQRDNERKIQSQGQRSRPKF
jgi:hypothetical protein